MYLYKFTEKEVLRPNVSIVYTNVRSNESRITDEIHLGAYLNIKDIFKMGWKVRKEEINYRENKASSEYIIQGDNKPRVIYSVYKLEKPERKRDGEKLISDFHDTIDSLYGSKKPHVSRRHLRKFTSQTFAFYACLEVFEERYPSEFFVTEKTMDFDKLAQSVQNWDWVAGNNVRVEKSNVYFKLQLPVSPRETLICAYMHWIKLHMCVGCHHNWSHQELLDLLNYRKVYQDSKEEIVPHDEAYRLQKNFKRCMLWKQFVNENAFIRKTSKLSHAIDKINDYYEKHHGHYS